MNEQPLYVPAGSLSLDKVVIESQLRLGIQGKPGIGKTWSALTFPNCVVENFDAGLRVHMGRSDVIDVPMWDDKFVDSIIMRDGEQAPPNRKDAHLIWINSEARKLSTKQTLVIDSNRQIQGAYHTQYKLNPVISKKGRESGFVEWTQKNEYFERLGTLYKALHCNVIYLCHEVDDVDKETGESNGKIKPALSGESGRTIASDFTDWYRQIAIEKPRTQERIDALCSSETFGRSVQSNLQEWLKSTPDNHDAIYLWQITSDDKCVCKTSLLNAPKFVIAHASTFDKYKRTNKGNKNETTSNDSAN